MTTQQPTWDDLRLLSREDLTDAPAVTPEQATENRAKGRGLRAPRPERKGLLGISEATFDRWVATGLFPPPMKLGRLVRWRGRVVRLWLESQPTKQLSLV